MGTNVNLTPKLERFAQACVESGRFNNVSEVVRSGLRMLQEAEERRAAFVASLETAREEGLREGFARVKEVEIDVKAAIDVVRQRRRCPGGSLPYERSARCAPRQCGSPRQSRSR